MVSPAANSGAGAVVESEPKHETEAAPAAENGADDKETSEDTGTLFNKGTAEKDDTSPKLDAENNDVSGKVATAEQMTTIETVEEDGMVPVTADNLVDGVYSAQMNSSSSMFRITDCVLTVQNGEMLARMTMGGTSYLYVYPGSAEEAASAEEADYISFEEDEAGVHSFTIPVTALDQGFPCAAYSKNKELWYDRMLLVRADSLPADAFVPGFFTTVESLGLADGEYTADVQLTGGSGKASIGSPARFVVTDGQAVAEIAWSSSNYDYMKVDGEQYLPVNTEGNSLFQIPLRFFDRPFGVLADTTAMSQPHEIAYSLRFDSGSILQAAAP